MNVLLAVRLAASLAMPADTPPPPPLRDLFAMKTVEDLRALSRLTDGSAVPPDLQPPAPHNENDIIRYILRNYPMSLRNSTEQQLGYAWMHINAHGLFTDIVLIASTGHREMDAVARQALIMLRFAPARIDTMRVGVWMPYPIQIGTYFELLAWSRHQQERPDSFTRYTMKPMLQNRAEVTSELRKRYPGVDGRVNVWVDLDVEGAVLSVRIARTSGNERLDDAALHVARVMRFSPARNGETPVAVTIQLPIVFRGSVVVP